MSDDGPLGPPRPVEVLFFGNGTAAVGDQYGRQMGKYQCGCHADTIAALEADGIQWDSLNVWGSPQRSRPAWLSARSPSSPEKKEVGNG